MRARIPFPWDLGVYTHSGRVGWGAGRSGAKQVGLDSGLCFRLDRRGLDGTPPRQNITGPNSCIGKLNFPGAPMPKTYSDLFSEVRDSIKTISLEALKARLEARAERPFTLVDVREKDEVRQGFIP